MSIPFSESRTRQNLMRSFLGETGACIRYRFAAETAEREQLHVIAAEFAEIAGHEEAHARLFRGLLARECGSVISFEADCPADAFPSTPTLLAAAEEDARTRQEWLYPSFADTADAEGFAVHGQLWRMVAEVEGSHRRRLHNLVGLTEAQRLFEERLTVEWRCMNCGHLHRGKSAPSPCPLCRYDRGWFQRI